MSVLSVLVFKGPCSPSELATIEQVSKPTMSNLIKGLEREGYVQTKPSVTDKRSSVVKASAKGKRLLQKGQNNRIETLKKMIETLDSDDLGQLENAAEVIEGLLVNPPKT